MNRRPRGFTLIELMVAVAIVGILASVALPNFRLATLRARKTERDLVVDGISRSLQGVLIRNGKFGEGLRVGEFNPDGEPTPQKRPFNYGATAWKDLDLQVQGHVYYSYAFEANEAATPMTLTVRAKGDLDGDGVQSLRRLVFELRDGGLWQKIDDSELPGIF